MTEQVLRLFVSSPGDVPGERRRIDFVVERLNAEFAGRVRIETVRWERSYYSAHDTFQRQIPEAGECDVVVAVFRGRLGTPLPPEFPPLPSGEPYPSGTAYEILSAIEVRKAGKRVPDVYVFRYPHAPQVGLDAPDRPEVEAQWSRLKGFFDRWFLTQAGQFVAAFQTYLSTDEFAVKVEDCLRQWLAGRGFLPHGPVWDRLLHGSPFPGLAAFEADRASVFFGRDGAIGQAVTRLREADAPGRAPFLLLLGASGAGKSSLLRAGLLPRLLQPGALPEVDLWRCAVMTPGADPFAALADALFTDAALGAELRAGTFRTREMLARQLAGEPMIALAPLRDALDRAAVRRQGEAGFDAPRPARLLLGIDQAERLFAEAAPAVANSWSALLAAMVRQRLATVVMALRSDAYAGFQEVDALVGLRQDGATLDLLPPSAAELEAIITGPVAACAPPLAFEQRDGRSLAAGLAADARGGDALPLLQVSLARLYAAEAARGDGVLRFADYLGMDDAVTRTANDALATLDEPARAELPALVAGLVADVVTDPRTGQPTPLASALDRAAFERDSAPRAALVAAFVAKRLLTTEGALVRPVHEALLRIWPQAVAIVADTAALIRVRRTLEPLVRDWTEAEAKQSHLDLSPALLDGAQGLLARFGADLPAAMREFIAQAADADAARRDRERAEQERRIRDVEALAAARRRTTQRTRAGLAAAVVLAALAGWQWREAGQQRDRAQRSLTLATQTANKLVFDLAEKFSYVVGVPVATVKDILDRARQLQDQLLASGESTPALRASQAGALVETSRTLRTLGDTNSALATARQAQDVAQSLAAADPGSAAFQHGLALADTEIGDALRAQGDMPAALASFQAAYAINEKLVKAGNYDYAEDFLNAFLRLAQTYGLKGDLASELIYYQDALKLAEDEAKANPASAYWQLTSAMMHQEIGDVIRSQGNLPAALTHYEADLAISRHVADADPANAAAQGDVAAAYERIGDVQVAQGSRPAALASYQAAFAVSDLLARMDAGNTVRQRNAAYDRSRMAGVQLSQGDVPAALSNSEAVRAIRERLVSIDPSNTGFQSDLSESLRQVGAAQRMKGDLPAALASYQAAIAISSRLAATDPANGLWQSGLASSEAGLGDVQVAQGDLGAALTSYQAALSVGIGMAGLDATNAELQHELADLHENIGSARFLQGDQAAALTALQASYAIKSRLLAANPTSPVRQNELALLDSLVGGLHLSQGNAAAALASFKESLGIRQRLADAEPANAAWRRNVASSNRQMADAQSKLLEYRAALASQQAATAISAQLAEAAPDDLAAEHQVAEDEEKIGAIYVDLEDYPAALKSFVAARAVREQLVAKAPANAAWQRELAVRDNLIGRMQSALQDPGGALASYRAALDVRERLARADASDAGAQRDLASANVRVADAELDQNDPAAALALEQSALAIRLRLAERDPANAGSQHDLAQAYTPVGALQLRLGDLPAALASFQSGYEVFARLASNRADAAAQRELSVAANNVGDVQLQQGDLAAAMTRFQASLAIMAPLVRSDPGNAEWQHDLAAIYWRIGSAQAHSNAHDDALGSLRQGRDIIVKLIGRFPSNTTYPADLGFFDHDIAALAR